jgi:hypothetical protein
MIARLALLGVVLGVLWVVLSLAGDAGSPPPSVRPSASLATPEPEQPVSAPRVAPGRNLFRYGAASAPYPETDLGIDEPIPDASAVLLPTSRSRVRLVGLVRRGTVLMAALNVAGEVAVLAPGESVEGYTLLAVDEETGVRLGSRDGELTLDWPD